MAVNNPSVLTSSGDLGSSPKYRYSAVLKVPNRSGRNVGVPGVHLQLFDHNNVRLAVTVTQGTDSSADMRDQHTHQLDYSEYPLEDGRFF
jgi:hypothetical protein